MNLAFIFNILLDNLNKLNYMKIFESILIFMFSSLNWYLLNSFET